MYLLYLEMKRINLWEHKMKKKFTLILTLVGFSLLASACGSSDIDLDNIPNKLDECPQEAEDYDGYKDNDGCPDLDNDSDGVPDTQDQCIFDPEDRDGFNDQDGCPDNDNDGDKMPDNKDKCPNEPEDRDGFKDADGCPDPDNDGDGVLDVNDKCPIDKEDMDNFEDTDGCPEFDNDGDGIKDKFDICPLQPENVNGKEDDDGCPDRARAPLPEQFELVILFNSGTDELTYNSKVKLEEDIVKTLSIYPEHQLLVYLYMPRIELDLPEYLLLINNRSSALANYLYSKGIRENQLRIRTITEELYLKFENKSEDFNQNKKVKFVRKTIKK